MRTATPDAMLRNMKKAGVIEKNEKCGREGDISMKGGKGIIKIEFTTNNIEIKAKICLPQLRVNPRGGKFFTH